jgi:hypothetical protein
MAEAAPALDELLECSLCISTFVEPVSLKCLHSFCRECVEKYKKAENKTFSIQCPLCRTVCKADEITKDFFKLKLLQVYDSSKKHKREVCKLHPDEKVIRFCITCTTAICSECLIEGSHVGKGHAVKKLDDFDKQVASRLDTCQKKLSKLLSHVKSYDQTKRAESDIVHNIKVIIETREQEILRMLKDEKSKLFASLDDKRPKEKYDAEKAAAIEKRLTTLLDKIAATLGQTHLGDRAKNCDDLEKSTADEEKVDAWLLNEKVDELQTVDYEPGELPGNLLGSLEHIKLLQNAVVASSNSSVSASCPPPSVGASGDDRCPAVQREPMDAEAVQQRVVRTLLCFLILSKKKLCIFRICQAYMKINL